MNIHEYQSKEILQEYGLPTPKGIMVESVDDALKAYKQLNCGVCVVKAQIHAGGRGKGGGVILCKSEDEVKIAATKILHMTLVTHQTGPEGQYVRKIYIEEGFSIEKEFYLSLVLDRHKSCLTIIASSEGGMDIEDVAKNTPDKILKISINPSTQIMGYHSRRIGQAFGLTKDQTGQLGKILDQLYFMFNKSDAELIEINPLVLTKDGTLKILDAKISIDDNALFRHADLGQLRDRDEEDPSETKAREHDLNYIKLNGQIGCLVNGAGLAMATMDIIQLYGGQPANFLDVGGGATKEKVAIAFGIILSDPDVKGIFVNIFGGIMRCDIIAQGIVDAAKEMKLDVPLVVRLKGTNMQEGQKILSDSGLKICAIEDFEKAAKEIVDLVKS